MRSRISYPWVNVHVIPRATLITAYKQSDPTISQLTGMIILITGGIFACRTRYLFVCMSVFVAF